MIKILTLGRGEGDRQERNKFRVSDDDLYCTEFPGGSSGFSEDKLHLQIKPQSDPELFIEKNDSGPVIFFRVALFLTWDAELLSAQWRCN